MNDSTIFVGLDYHQASVQVCVEDSTGRVLLNRRCRNDWAGIAAAVEPLGSVSRVAIESCSGAANLAEELIRHTGWRVGLAHPGYVQRLKGSPDKTDFSDARLLADLERVGYVPRVWLAPHHVRELRRLVRYRQQLVNQRRDIKLRVGALLRDQRIRHAPARSWTVKWKAWLVQGCGLSEQSQWIVEQHLNQMKQLTEDIKAVESRLALLTKDDGLVTALLGLSGIGSVTAWTIRAEIGRFDRFTSGKQLSRFCGLSPRNASSGSRQADSGLIRAGNRQLRATLIEAAHRLIRYDHRWRALATALLGTGKPKCVVVAAVANRWVRWLFHKMQPARIAG